jgi:hypothetical protein
MAGKVFALVAALALLVVPGSALAAKGGKGKSKGCAKVATVGYQITGTLVSVTADDPLTPDSEASVTLTVTSANKHARESGELADQDADRKGVQAKGATYTVPAGDAYELRLGDDGALVPAAGDRVKVKGRIGVMKKRCGAEGTSTADRYATPDVIRVSISHPEPATETETETPAA